MCARNNSIARASARERSGPTAVACEVTMPCCNAEACDGIDPRVGERTEAGRDAVHRGAGGDGALDHVARSPDAAARAVAERHRCPQRDPLDIAQVDRLSELDGLAHRGEGYRFARASGVGAHERWRISSGDLGDAVAVSLDPERPRPGARRHRRPAPRRRPMCSAAKSSQA